MFESKKLVVSFPNDSNNEYHARFITCLWYLLKRNLKMIVQSRGKFISTIYQIIWLLDLQHEKKQRNIGCQETKKNSRNYSSFEVIKLHNKISIGCEIRAEYHQIKKKTPCTTGAYKSTHEIRENGDPEIVYHAFSALSSDHLSTYMRVESSERNKSDLRPSSGIKCLSIALSLDSSFQFLPKVYSNVNSFHHDEEEKFRI